MNREYPIPKNKLTLSVAELKKLDYTYYKINKSVDKGNLRKLNKSNYENCEYNGDRSELYYVTAYIPSGVICLMSAAVYYELTTYRPDTIDVAVSKNRRIGELPKWPEFNIYYFDKSRFESGVNKIKEEENVFNIYDIEKTIVDLIYYRNKIGIEEIKNILKNYLDRADRDINKLYRYAIDLKCEKILRTYLEVLV